MPKSKTITTFNITERVDKTRVIELLNSDYDIPAGSYETLINHIGGNGFPITYTPKNDIPDGRCYGEKGSLKYLDSKIRSYICQDSFIDLDIKNCFPEILRLLCKKHLIPHKHIEYYCTNRDEILSKDFTLKQQYRNVIMGCKTSSLPMNVHQDIQRSCQDLVEIMGSKDDIEKPEELDSDCEPYAIKLFEILSCYEFSKIRQVMDYINKKRSNSINAYVYDGLIVDRSVESMLPKLNELMYPLELVVKPWNPIKINIIHSREKFNWDDGVYGLDLISMNGSVYQSQGHCDKHLLPLFLKTVRLIDGNKIIKHSRTQYHSTRCDKDMMGNKWKIRIGKNPKDSLTFNALCSRYLQLIAIIGINPFGSDKPGELSLWRGFGYKSVEQVNLQIIEPILYHIREILCDNNDQLYKHFLSWIKHILTKVGKPSEVCYIFAGFGGTGKSTIGEFMKQVVGDWNVGKFSGTDKITRNFNSHLEGKILIWLEELKSAEQRDWIAEINTIKDLIDTKTLEIEKKHSDVVHIKNAINIIGFSNNLYCMPSVDGMDRRLVLTETSNKVKENFEYFSNLRNVMANPDVIDHFGTYIARDFEPVDIKVLPKTTLGEDSKFRWMCPTKKLLLFLYCENGDGWYSTNDFKQIGVHYNIFNGKDKAIARLGDDIKRYLGAMNRSKRKYYLTINSKFNPTQDEIDKTKEQLHQLKIEKGDLFLGDDIEIE